MPQSGAWNNSLAIRTLLYYLLVAEKALYFKGKPLNQASARPSAGGSLRHKNVIAAKELIDSCIFTYTATAFWPNTP
jgi:hypothetical protein